MSNSDQIDTAKWLTQDKNLLDELSKAHETHPEDKLVSRLLEVQTEIGQLRASGKSIYEVGDNVMVLMNGYTELTNKKFVRPIKEVVGDNSQPGREGVGVGKEK